MGVLATCPICPLNSADKGSSQHRLVAFAQTYQLAIKLAYYPPYHSKYNPVERCWGILENHWNGDVLDTVETVVKFTQTMSWQGKAPVVRLLTTIYHTGVRLTKQAMVEVETHMERLIGLERWFVDISCALPASPDT
jgi:Rhodopirellula transposase DDE domain